MARSANMPQLNNDGLEGDSANDWLAPVIAFVVLTFYADLLPPADPRRFGHSPSSGDDRRLRVNVITI